jgi:hypothetical protein
MRQLAWRALAWAVSRPAIADWLIRRSQATPYFHLNSYMERWWLFNPTVEDDPRRFEWLPSIRIHHILRGDKGRHRHNHPWDARTIILKGWYYEDRDDGDMLHVRARGYTGALEAGSFHHIAAVSPGGVWTLFFHWKWQHTWGFDTEQGFVPWKEYDRTAPAKAAERN